MTTHLDLIVKDVPASVVDDFALIQQSSSVLSASGGGQKVRRGRFQAASFGATRRRRLVGYQGVRDGVCRRRGRVTSASRPVNSAVGKAVRGGTWLGLSLNRLGAGLATTHAFFSAQIHLFRLCTLSAPSCQLVLYLISAFRTSLPCSGKESTTTIV